MVIREVDKQGRVVIPKDWREKHVKKGRVLMVLGESEIKIFPIKPVDLTKYFDSIEVDIKSDLSDWRSVRKELRSRG